MRDLGGDGRLRQVYKTVGQALLAHPVLYLLIVAFGAAPLYFFIMGINFNNGHFNPNWAGFIAITNFSFISALTIKTSHLSAAEKMSRIDIIQTLKKTPILAFYFAFYLLILGSWLLVFRTITETYVTYHSSLIIIWVIIFLAIIFILPAFFFLFPVVYLMENCALGECFLKSWTMGRTYRLRIIGYFAGTFTIGFIAVAALLAISITALKSDDSAMLQSWASLAHATLFWVLLNLVASALYMQLRHARGEVSVEDVADIFK
jgi:hypothetical protein